MFRHRIWRASACARDDNTCLQALMMMIVILIAVFAEGGISARYRTRINSLVRCTSRTEDCIKGD
jgi:hypothetical protein